VCSLVPRLKMKLIVILCVFNFWSIYMNCSFYGNIWKNLTKSALFFSNKWYNFTSARMDLLKLVVIIISYIICNVKFNNIPVCIRV
jgi:hypothetical protein